LWTQLYLGLGFTTLATLILELSLTRIFSVVFYYHFAFLAISIALFGLGAGGVFSYVVSGWRGNVYAKLGTLGLANSLCVVASLWFILSRTGDPSNITLALVYVASALPFFLAGTIVSIAISEAMERVDRAYFFDLAGAASGCLLLIPFLHLFGGPNTVIAAGVLYGVAAAIWFNQASTGGRRRAAAVLTALVLVVLMVANGKMHFIDVHTAKGQAMPPERFTAWNSFSRIGVTRVDVSWEAGTHWTIIIDGDAGTGIYPDDWHAPQERFKLLHQGPGFPYALRPNAKALIIGPGGGWDIARALAGGSQDITAVEINPIIADQVMRDKMVAESHGIYFQPGVRVVKEDGRSFVRGSQEKYQVVQATLVDTWASTAAGAFALSENNLYTSDAFYDYLSHLTDDGVLTFTRWGFDPPRESLRLVTLGMDALGRLGENDAARHVIAMREDTARLRGWGALDTVVISRKAFSAKDADRARQIIADSHMEAIYLPGDPPANPFGQLLTASDPRAFLDNYQYDVSAVSDDRPFFFYTVQPRDLWNFFFHASTESADYKVNRAVPLLFGVVGISLAATILVLLLPRWLLGTRLPKQKGVIAFLWYFLCLGAGYILIQVALIQKFVLLLGQPTYALTVIVFSMLVASGLGSFLSRKIVGDEDGRLAAVLIGVAVLVGALAAGARPLVTAAATWPLGLKVTVTALAIAPAAFLMGMPFPSGLRRLERRHAPSVRWAWSLNAAASVLGSAGAIFLAIYLGLRTTLLIGGVLYIAALAVILSTRTQVRE
jgi:predicted membrane-bound spermidine synthase